MYVTGKGKMQDKAKAFMSPSSLADHYNRLVKRLDTVVEEAVIILQEIIRQTGLQSAMGENCKAVDTARMLVGDSLRRTFDELETNVLNFSRMLELTS